MYLRAIMFIVKYHWIRNLTMFNFTNFHGFCAFGAPRVCFYYQKVSHLSPFVIPWNCIICTHHLNLCSNVFYLHFGERGSPSANGWKGVMSWKFGTTVRGNGEHALQQRENKFHFFMTFFCAIELKATAQFKLYTHVCFWHQ